MFDIKQPYIEEANEVFSILNERNIRIENQSILDSFERDLRCLRRIHEIYEYNIHNIIEHEKLREIADEYDSPVEITDDGDGVSLGIDDLRSRFEILDLIGDNYLRSELTDLSYTADGKALIPDS
jgi:hypothetical protein